MQYKDTVRDFAERTIKNLEAIEKMKNNNSNADVYEVTQLINSLLGLLVLIREHIIDDPSSLSKLEKDLHFLFNDHNEDPKRLIRSMRNAVAHFNIKLKSDHNNQIDRIVLWNECNKSKKNWEIELPIDHVRKIVYVPFNITR